MGRVPVAPVLWVEVEDCRRSSLPPSRLGGLLSNGRQLLFAELLGSRVTSLESSQATEGDGGGVFLRLFRFVCFRFLPGGFKHYAMGKLIGIARAIL
jgi:hypothetical protein